MTMQGGPTTPPHVLVGTDLHLTYDSVVVAENLDVQVPRGALTMIIGPNGCGKSTLLKALARMLRPQQGTVLLDGADIHDAAHQGGGPPARPAAAESDRARGHHRRRPGLARPVPLPAAAAAVVARRRGDRQRGDGRRPAWPSSPSAAVDELSGGERQRVWLAMVLAQQTNTLLLDEPTTYLDLAHQLDVLELCATVKDSRGR